MQGPGGMSQNPVDCGLKGEERKEEDRDPCSSPPQKRLKQAHIPFKATSPTSVNNGEPKSNKELETPMRVESSFFEGKKDKVISGMVKAKPHSPDEKKMKLDSNMNMLEEETPEKLDNGHSEESSENADVLNQTPIKSSLNTSTSSVESSPDCSANQDDGLKVISVVTPSHSKRITKLAKSSEKLKREAERQAKREEREAQRLEKQKLKEKEKQEAKAKKEEAKRKKELEMQLKKEEKEKKEKEKLEKKMIEDKEREDKNKKKEEERKRKEEEKLAKMEEKNKKEEERKQQEEEEMRKKQRAQNMFKSFFKPVAATPKQVAPVPKNTFEERFQPFVISKDMEMAPRCRRKSFDEEFKQALVESMSTEDYVSTYCEDVKTFSRSEQRREKNKNTVSENDSDELVIVAVRYKDNENMVLEGKKETDNKEKKTHKAKLFQFHLNTRPPYYGTWTKKSKLINPRNPLAMDKDLLDYEVDSDEEWEEEDPGESISHSEGEDEAGDNNANADADADADEDDEDEDGFFVPHGYLSDDEGVGAEEEEEKSGLEFDPEKKREQLLKKSRAWEAELARKCKPMKPAVIGCSWTHTGTVDNRLLQYQICNIIESPIEVSKPIPKDLSRDVNDNNTPSRHPMAMYVPEEAMPKLIEMLHGNTAGLVKVMKNFRKYWTTKNQENSEGNELNESNCSISKRQLERKINEIAVKERRPNICSKACWYVHEKVLHQYGLQDIKIKEQTSTSPIEESNSGSRSVTPTLTAPSLSQSTPSILQFTRVSSPTNVKASAEINTSSPKGVIKPTSVPAKVNSLVLNDAVNSSVAGEKSSETVPEPMETESTIQNTTAC